MQKEIKRLWYLEKTHTLEMEAINQEMNLMVKKRMWRGKEGDEN